MGLVRPARRPGLSCVVLAGGESRRFGRNKLTALIESRPVIARVAERVSGVTPDVYYSVARRGSVSELRAAVGARARFIVDSPRLHPGGPPRAILTCRASLRSQVLFVPGDIPWVEGAALSKFVSLCRSAKTEIGTIYWPNGRTENLIQLHRRSAAMAPFLELGRLRGSLMRASDFLRGAAKTLYVDACMLTDDPYCFSNINRPEDLVKPSARGPLHGGKGNLVVDGHPKDLFWRAVRSEAAGRFEEAAEDFRRESECYQRLAIVQIADQCRADRKRALQQASLEPS